MGGAVVVWGDHRKMAAEKERLMKIEAAQSVVDCYAGAERAIIEAMKQVVETINCVDMAAREANAAGADVRSFDLVVEQATHVEALAGLGKALGQMQAAHKSVWDRAKLLDVDVPRPKTGGR